MGDFKGRADKQKTKENKYIMEAGKVKIGKSVVSYDEKMLIPLDAISFVEIPEQEKNEQGACVLKIENHAGRCFYITASDMDFIKEIRSALMICIHDRNAVYSGKERTAAIGVEKVYGDKIIAAGKIRVDKTKRPGTVTPKEEKSGRAETITILDDEWKTLEEYAIQRMKDFQKNERNYTICKAMAASAELKNREKCKRILDVSGNDALDMIIAGAPIGVKAIVNKIM